MFDRIKKGNDDIMTHDKNNKRCFLYGGLDNILFWDELDTRDMTLTRGGQVDLAANIQFAARSADGRFLYVVVSDAGSGTTGAAGTIHGLQVMEIGAENGSLSLKGEYYPLPERPIHISLDKTGRYAAVSFNKSGQIRLYRLDDDGSVTGEVEQDVPLKAGIFTHQAVFSSDQKHIITVSRGNTPQEGKPEERGEVSVFSFSSETGRAVFEGRSEFPVEFGPRHLIFSADHKWGYLAIERGSMIFTYALKNGLLDGASLFRTETLQSLSNRTAVRQRGGVGVLHPNGKYLYVSNRADKTETYQGQDRLVAGENNIAIFKLDEQTGEPKLMGRSSCHGAESRNMVIDPTGTVFIAVNQKSMHVPDGDGWRFEPACLSVFQIMSEGNLSFVRRYDLHEQGNWLSWAELYPLGGAHNEC
ncbi:beta-propeller fold lactonase family protein [uncultured Megasphaera sp.]|uniref:lactonase family protein n=4 Tax=Megasphaera TaxID=906 RepID=UPI0025EF6332|nr:beta-propeller fold lactonase family protein [uncultured Megasphaera sp.]